MPEGNLRVNVSGKAQTKDAGGGGKKILEGSIMAVKAGRIHLTLT